MDDLLNNSPTPEQDERLSKEEYAEMKRTERDAVYELSDNTALDVAADGGRFKEYLDVQARFDRYSATNALLVLAQKPDATRIGNGDHWKGQDCYIKRGEKSFNILEPGREFEREDGTIGVSYNVRKVFDVSQVDSHKQKAATPPSYNDRQLLNALVKGSGVRISGVDRLPDNLPAMSDPNTGNVTVCKAMGFADTFSAIAQELCSSAVQQSERLPTEPRFTAYCAAYLVCKKHGVDTQAFSFESAPSMFRGFEGQKIKQELSAIRDAAENISGRMTKQLDAVQKTAKEQGAR